MSRSSPVSPDFADSEGHPPPKVEVTADHCIGITFVAPKVLAVLQVNLTGARDLTPHAGAIGIEQRLCLQTRSAHLAEDFDLPAFCGIGDVTRDVALSH